MIFRVAATLMSFIMLAVLSGCSVLPERSAKKTFMLSTPDLPASDQNAIPITLRVLRPHADSPLDSSRILVNPQGQAIEAYGGARWSKPIPVLIRDQWIDGLRQSGSLRAVINETSGAVSDLSLSSDLTRFQVHYRQGQPEVIIEFDVQLLESTSRRIIATQRFRVQHAVADQPVETVVAGFGEANQALTEELVGWLISVSRELYEETDQARPL